MAHYYPLKLRAGNHFKKTFRLWLKGGVPYTLEGVKLRATYPLRDGTVLVEDSVTGAVAIPNPAENFVTIFLSIEQSRLILPGGPQWELEIFHDADEEQGLPPEQTTMIYGDIYVDTRGSNVD